MSLARFWRRRAKEASREVGTVVGLDGWVNNPYDKLDEMGLKGSGSVSMRILVPVAPSPCTRHSLAMDSAGRVSCTVCGVAFRTGT